MIINYDPRLIDVARQFYELAPKGCITTLTETYLAGGRRRPELVISAFPACAAAGWEIEKSEKFKECDVDVRIDWYEEKEEPENAEV